MKSVNLKKAVLLSCSVLMIAGLGSACKEKPKVQIAPEEKLPISLTLSQEEFSVMVEETVKIPVSVKNATEAVAFTSTNPSVATVDNNGVVTGLAEGETEIIISVEGVTDSCLVIVTKNIYVPYIAVGNIETNEMNLLKGGNFTLQSVVKKGQNVLTAPISYSSADTSIAEISQEGVITAKNYGTTTIMLTSTYQGLSFEYSVTVNVCRDIIIQSPVESIQLYTNNSLGGLMEYNISNVQITEDGRALATDYEVLSMDEGVVSVSDKTLTMVAVGETQVVLRCTIDNIHYEKYLNVSVNNPQLATVDNFVLTGTDLTWDAVEGAAYYTVYDGDKQNDTLQPTYDLSEAYGAGMVTVVAHPLGNDILSSEGGRFQYNIDHINLLDRALQRTYVEYTSMQAVTEEDYTEDGAIYLVKLGNSNLCSPTYGYTFKKVYTSPAFAEKVDWGTGNLVDTSKLSFDYATSSVSMWVYTYTETTFYYVSMKSSFARTMQSFVTVPAHQWTKIDFPVVLDACAYITAETTEFFVTDMKLYSTGYQDNNYATLPYNYATVVQEYIDALPEKGMATIEYTDDIREARKQYEYLNDALKEKIVGLDKLESAELQIVNDLIATLDTNSLTSKDFENIAKALKLYNDTPDYLKEQVDYTVLRTAEANIVDACIAEIPELDKLTIKDGDKVFYAKQVYDSISEEAKGQVQNLSKLNALETQIVQLYIDALPQENDVEMLDMEAIINAQYFVTKLSEEQKATLENLSKIEKAVARLQSMSKVLYSMESLTGLKKSSNFPGSNCYDIKTATDTRYGNVLEIDLHTLPTAGDGHIAIQYENQENFAQILEGCSYVYVSIYNGSEMDMTCYADFGGSTNLSYAMLEAQGWTLLEIPVADFMSGTYFGILNSKLGSTPATYKISAIFTTETRYQGVVRMIENLPDPSTITAFDYAQIVKAEEAYKNLSNEMKAQVSNYQTL